MNRHSRLIARALALGALAVALALPSVAAASPTVRFEDDDLGLTFAGAWRAVWAAGASGDTVRVSQSSGARVTASFTGSAVSLIGRRGPDLGQVRVTVDGAPVADVDCYDPIASEQIVLWSSAGLPEGAHTVIVESLAASNPSSSGVAFAFDAFEIAGVPVRAQASGTGIADGSPRLAKSGRWWVSKRAAAIGKRGWRTTSKGATIIASFKGTGITWFGLKDRDGGFADVYLDGRKVATVGQFAPVVREQAVAYSASGLKPGSHTLTIKALGRAGEAAGKKIDVDGFLVEGSVLKAYLPSPFKYTWKNYIVVDKSQYRLYWVKNGKLIKTYPVAVGRIGMTTPSRVWRVGIKYKTDPRGVYGPRKLRLFKRVGRRYIFTAYGIHGTNQEWVIGTRASHGCIRMYNKDVLELWPQVPVGTMVVTRD